MAIVSCPHLGGMVTATKSICQTYDIFDLAKTPLTKFCFIGTDGRKEKGLQKTDFFQQWSVILLRFLPAPGLKWSLQQHCEGSICLLVDCLADLIPGERDWGTLAALQWVIKTPTHTHYSLHVWCTWIPPEWKLPTFSCHDSTHTAGAMPSWPVSLGRYSLSRLSQVLTVIWLNDICNYDCQECSSTWIESF